MRLRSNEVCPIHKSVSCCGRELMPKPKLIRLGVQRIEDPHHPRGYRELRSRAEMRKLLNRKITEQKGICANLRGEVHGLQRYCPLCRHRHKARNADFQNMPTGLVLISDYGRIVISKSA